METWLDTETRALLQRSPPNKLAPPDTARFTLVLLAITGSGRERLLETVRRVLECSPQDALLVLAQPLPVPLKSGLAHEDALLGQFELACCDAISVFLADEVAAHGASDYLTDLYGRLLQSPEFEIVSMRLESIPENPQGEDFLRQFVGRTVRHFPIELKVLRKKARIMEHLAAKIGGRATPAS
jgi:hypothetical protein